MCNKDKGPKDMWDKASALGGIITALAVAFLGIIGSCALEKTRKVDADNRLYTEIMTKREEAESALRKDMFNTIIHSFLKAEPGFQSPRKEDLEYKVLQFELLAHNFHESLNLRPLYAHLRRQIIQSKSESEQNYLDRLENAAGDISSKQRSVLEGVREPATRTIEFAQVQGKALRLDPIVLTLQDITRTLDITVTKVEPKWKEVLVTLTITTKGKYTDKNKSLSFWVGLFDLPFIDNVRLSDDQRCALVLTAFTKDRAEIAAFLFPGSYASLREKPVIEEVLKKRLNIEQEIQKEMVE